MSNRYEPFINNEIYHVYNKTIDLRLVFETEVNCNKFLGVSKYYRSSKAKISYSRLADIDPLTAFDYLKKVNYHKYFRVEILIFCFMPTHFHFLIKQKKDKGISRFIADIVNSFTRYFNIKNDRQGPLFLTNFKSVKVNNEAQFMHVSRYIHLNPYSNGLIDKVEDLENFSWSSFRSYVHGGKDNFVNKKDLLLLFNNDKKRYKRFVLSNAEHQKTLEIVKYSGKWL